VPLAAAALQFPLAHSLVASVIPGLDSSERVEQTLALYRHKIPPALWQELRSENLIRPDAPIPA
jgi:D-threo-aldose 1-dehydrogenase